MPSNVKLTYFNITALGEPIRMLLSYSDIDFEDERIEKDDWPKHKPSTPFGKMPILEIDGKRVTQSTAICRYLGKKCGLGGKDEWEDLEIHAAADNVKDLIVGVANYHYEKNEAAKADKWESTKEFVEDYVKRLDEHVAKNDGYLVNGRLTWADVFFAGVIDYTSMMYHNTDILADAKNLKALKDKVFAEPKIKAWIDKRPESVLHKISEVLEPVQPHRINEPIYNPDAYQFLNQSENLKLGQHRVRTFHQRVKENDKVNVFSSEGKFTFFIPVDEGFKPAPRAGKIDRQVIDGHVIPNHVLFTAPTPSNKPYETLAFGDNLKVTISFSTEHSDKGVDKYYVKSDTLVGDSTHPSASVLAEIVKPNIPVKNGVVHLIQNPLMVIDTTLQEFIQDKEDGPLFKFYEVIRDQTDDFIRSVSRHSNITLFAPKNAAWEEAGVKQILQDQKRVKELLNLHFVKDYVPLDVIERKTIRQVSTVQPRASLYFNVVEGPSGNHTVTVEGGGVNATIITANIGATNGIIHIIDRVLGVPYTTVLDKLRTDPTLRKTYELGNRQDFNRQLSDPKRRYTFFAPQDSAWDFMHTHQPSVYKKMFMEDFAYHTKQILERHLVVGHVYTMKELYELAQRDELRLSAMRDKLEIKIREVNDQGKVYDENAIRPKFDGDYLIVWKGMSFRVVRPDVGCTNGIIHVIERVMLQESDIQVTGAATTVSSSLIFPVALVLSIAQWFL